MKCSKCNTKMVRNDSFAYTSDPLQYDYTCPKCGEKRIGTAEADYDVEEPVSDDLGEAAKNYSAENVSYWYDDEECVETYNDAEKLEQTFKAGAEWQKQQMIAKAVDAMICLPYENEDGGYTHLIDVSRPLPVGNNKIAIIFKKDEL